MTDNSEFLHDGDRAGFLPYYLNEDGDPVFKFMIPSDFRYGGPLPGIAKGQIDKGESTLEAALREASEEVGLKKSNIKKGTTQEVWNDQTNGKYESYHLTVYAGEIKDKENFGKPHFETGEVRWMTWQQFSKGGKQNQKVIVEFAHRLITRKIK